MVKLWYTTSPKEWMEGIPIGNGRLLPPFSNT